MQIEENNYIPNQAIRNVEKGKALVFAPHPDDEVFGCGGAIISHIKNGDQVEVIIVTDGGLSVAENQKYSDYPLTRKKESLSAAYILGYGEPEFLNYPDGGLIVEEKLINQLQSIISNKKPEFVYLPAESEIHPDHIALHKAGTEAAQRLGTKLTLVYYEIGHIQKTNLLLDITDAQELLNKAMDCFSSQLAVQDYKKHINALHVYRTYTLNSEIKAAEAYFAVKLVGIEVNHPFQLGVLHNTDSAISNSGSEELPLISVIVRTMGRPELSEALQSIADQTYSNIEVILVDARGTNQLIVSDLPSKIKIRIISKNIPLNRPAAANAGLEAVSGKYFCFLDDDDLILPTHIDDLFQHLVVSDAPAAYSIVEMFNEKSESLCLFNYQFSFEKLVLGNYIPNLALLFRSEVIQQGCLFDIGFSVYEDWDFLIQVALLGEFLFVDKLGGVYRNNNSSGVFFDHNKTLFFRKKIYAKWIEILSNDQFNRLLNTLSTQFEEIDHKNAEIYQLKNKINLLNYDLCQAVEELSQKDKDLSIINLRLEQKIAEISQKEDELYYKDKALSGKDKELDNKQVEINQQNTQLTQKNEEIKMKNTQLNQIFSSGSWRITKPLRFAVELMKNRYHF